jgi:hypothetical protein
MTQSYTGTKKYGESADVIAAREAVQKSGQVPKNLQTAPVQEQENTEIVATLTYGAGKTEQVIGANAHDLRTKLSVRSQELKAAGEYGKVLVNYITRPIQVAPVVQPVTVEPTKSAIQSPKNVEKVETKDFVATIKQENGQWVGELVYKVGGGTERFTAPNKNGLTLQMLVGKGHASVQVRRMAREQKFGTETEKSYLFEGFTQAEYDALPETAKQGLIDAAARSGALIFKNAHPEYYNTNNNWQTIKRFLDKKELPYTAVNLEYAYDMLVDELETQEPTVVSEAPLPEDSEEVVSPAQVTAAEPTPQPQLRKRGTTGLLPNFSGGGNVELDQLEESNGPRELSEAELKALPLPELKKLYQAGLKRDSYKKNRQF